MNGRPSIVSWTGLNKITRDSMTVSRGSYLGLTCVSPPPHASRQGAVDAGIYSVYVCVYAPTVRFLMLVIICHLNYYMYVYSCVCVCVCVSVCRFWSNSLKCSCRGCIDSYTLTWRALVGSKVTKRGGCTLAEFLLF